jgi:hypothetical protein
MLDHRQRRSRPLDAFGQADERGERAEWHGVWDRQAVEPLEYGGDLYEVAMVVWWQLIPEGDTEPISCAQQNGR